MSNRKVFIPTVVLFSSILFAGLLAPNVFSTLTGDGSTETRKGVDPMIPSTATVQSTTSTVSPTTTLPPAEPADAVSALTTVSTTTTIPEAEAVEEVEAPEPITEVQAESVERAVEDEPAVDQAPTTVSNAGSCGGDLPPCYVMHRESGGNPGVVNPSSGAAGKWQFMPATWSGYGGYSTASEAPESVQDDYARMLWANGAGCGHWSAC